MNLHAQFLRMNLSMGYRIVVLQFLILTIISPAFCVSKKTEITGSNSTKEIVFSGITWKVRSGTGNPGGNNWSDSSESVWVDDNGTLHLKIRQIDGKWYCSEIYSDETVGYGEYRFYVASNVENLDQNVVVGLFTYLNDKNEIDIEFSKWGNAAEDKMGNYATQPARTAGNSLSFELGLNGSYSTHRFIWKPDGIDFKSWHGHEFTSTENMLIENWKYTGADIPVPGGENLIINLWLFKGNPPDDGREVEILVKSVNVFKPPVIDDLDVTISANTPVHTIIDSLSTPGYDPTDLDFSIVEGNDMGIFSVSDDGKLILEKVLDYETSDFHRLKVVAKIGDMQDMAEVQIHVENVVEAGLDSEISRHDFHIYPNPAIDELHIDFSGANDFEFRIIGMDGKLFQVNKIGHTDHSVRLNVGNLNVGNYLLLIKSNENQYSYKFQKR